MHNTRALGKTVDECGGALCVVDPMHVGDIEELYGILSKAAALIEDLPLCLVEGVEPICGNDVLFGTVESDGDLVKAKVALIGFHDDEHGIARIVHGAKLVVLDAPLDGGEVEGVVLVDLSRGGLVRLLTRDGEQLHAGGNRKEDLGKRGHIQGIDESPCVFDARCKGVALRVNAALHPERLIAQKFSVVDFHVCSPFGVGMGDDQLIRDASMERLLCTVSASRGSF